MVAIPLHKSLSAEDTYMPAELYELIFWHAPVRSVVKCRQVGAVC